MSATEQPFQDLYLSGIGTVLSIGIVPHFEVLIGDDQLAILRRLMYNASNNESSYDDRNQHENDIGVERMTNDNTIHIGNSIIHNLTDRQWVALYDAFKEFGKEVLESDGNVEDWNTQIPADADAYLIFKKDDTRSDDAFQKQLHELFSETPVILE